jgi:MFS family permease
MEWTPSLAGVLEKGRRLLGMNRTILALSFARMADGIGNSILFVIIPLYVAAIPDELLPLPVPLLVAVLISVYGLANAALQPFTARLTDRVGRYKLIIQAGLVLLSLTTFAFIFASRYLDVLVLRIIQGVGLALEIPATMALLAMASRRETRGAAMGLYTTLRMLGLAIGPVIGGFLHVHFGNRAAFIGGAVILFLAIGAVQFGVKRQPVRVLPKPRERKHGAMTAGLFSAALATFLMAVAFTLVTTLENEFNRRLDINALGFSFAFSALMVSRLLFQVPMGHFSDRRGRKPFVLSGLLLLAVTTGLLGEVASLFQFISLRFLQGIAAAAIVAPAIAYAGDVTQEGESGQEGRQMSTVTIGFGLGIAVGPLLAGLLALVSFEMPFLITGLLCLVGAWVVGRWMTEVPQS